jgi:hypothetical protein
MIKSFFTLPDPELTQESSFDPMGIMPIWMYFGQQLFGDKLTTIANDVRVFTFNLFHHYFIFDFFRKHLDEIVIAKQKFKNWQTDAEVKAGMLMLLEDLVAHIFYIEGENKSEIENLGILGYSKARQLHNTTDIHKIMLTASKNSGLLKNQLNLGMTGRYKGPMMNMRYFDRSFAYIPETWEHVSAFFEKWAEAKELKDVLAKLVLKLVLPSKNKIAPTISIQDIKNANLWRPISNSYLNCFGKKKLPKLVQFYWKDKLGLNSGAPTVLYLLVGQQKDIQNFDHKAIFQSSLKSLKSEPSEMAKVQRILDIEPFLSYSEYAARFLSQPSVKKIEDEKEGLIQLRNKINQAANFNLDTQVPRLTELHRAMTAQGSLEDWLFSVLNYHKKINTDRGGNSWYDIESNGNVKHNFSPTLNEKYNTIEKYLDRPFWFHTYYLETLRSIYQGMQ